MSVHDRGKLGEDASTLTESDGGEVLVIEDEPVSAEFPTVSPDHYDLHGEIGRGGMGRVLKARDRRLGREVALKELAGIAPTLQERFIREATITARLQHPAIVPVYEAGCWPSGQPFYAMKLVEGKTLRAMIGRTQILEERLALLPNLLAVAEAVAYAHSKRVVHRDLKASNVVIGPFGETMVLDWGLAKDLSEREVEPAAPYRSPPEAELTRAGAIIGTPTYMPPEQAQGAAVDERADVYALGAMLYHLLTGQAPYIGSDSDEILKCVLAGPPQPLSELEPHAPAELQTIVAKAMARDPEDRYQSAGALAEDLRRYQTGKLVTAHAYSTWSLVARWARRHRALVLSSSLFIVAGSVMGAVAVRRVVAERDRAEVARREAEKQRDVAEGNRLRAENYSRSLLLEQARVALNEDPTLAIVWLREYVAAGGDARAASMLADDAISRGVARHVLAGAYPYDDSVAASPSAAIVAYARRDGRLVLLLADSGKQEILETGQFTNLQFSADGSWLAARRTDYTVVVWNMASGQRREVGPFVQKGSQPFAFSRDSRRLFVARGGVLVEHDLREALTYTHDVGCGSIHQMAVLPSGNQIVLAVDADLWLWDRHTGGAKKLASLPARVAALLASSTGEHVVATSLASIYVYDVRRDRVRPLGSERALQIEHSRAGGHLLRIPPPPTAERPPGAVVVTIAHRNTVQAYALSPDGRQLASSAEESVIVWDLNAGAPTQSIADAGVVTDIAFSPDGRRLATISEDGVVRVWSRDGRKLATLTGHREAGTAISWSHPDRLVSWGHDRTARVWDSPRLRSLDANGWVVEPTTSGVAASSPDGRLRLVDQQAAATDLGAGCPLPVSVAATGDVVACVGKDSMLKIVERGTAAVRSVELPAAVRSMQFSGDSARLAIVDMDNTLRVFEAETLHEIIQRKLNLGEGDIHVFSDVNRIVNVNSERRTMSVYDMGSGTRLFEQLHPDTIWFVASRGGHVLATWSSGDVRVWRGGAVEPTAVIEGGRVQTVSPDGTLVAGSSMNEVVVHDASSGAQLYTLGGHRAMVVDVAFYANGERLASLDRAGVLRLWDPATGESRELGLGEPRYRSLLVSDDGTVVAVHDARGILHIVTDECPRESADFQRFLERRTSATLQPDLGAPMARTPAVEWQQQ